MIFFHKNLHTSTFSRIRRNGFRRNGIRWIGFRRIGKTPSRFWPKRILFCDDSISSHCRPATVHIVEASAASPISCTKVTSNNSTKVDTISACAIFTSRVTQSESAVNHGKRQIHMRTSTVCQVFHSYHLPHWPYATKYMSIMFSIGPRTTRLRNDQSVIWPTVTHCAV